MKRIAIFGATGSIGTQALDVLTRTPEPHQIVGLAAHSRSAELAQLAARHGVHHTALTDADAAPAEFASPPLRGPEAMLRLLDACEPDLVVHAVTGAAGLPVALECATRGIDLAIANKESLVMAGPLLLATARANNAQVIPVDSEHSALLQCARAGRAEEIRQLWLTASGGPFRGRRGSELNDVTPEQALAHPTWRMGPKISIDSATLMNKGLELIEAHVLFDVDPDQIRVVVHPESVVHSMVEFYDGSFIAHLGATDMRIPIQYALSQPRRWPRPESDFSLTQLGALHFEEPDHETFPALQLARQSCRAGGTAPVVFNAANERAVELFLGERIPFPRISQFVQRALDNHQPSDVTSLQQVLEIDQRTRAEIRSMDLTTLTNLTYAVLGVGFLIFVHELGHFLAAKKVGIRVDTFCIGFQPTIFGFKARFFAFKRGETEYALGMVPFGGYVRMAGEELGDEKTGSSDEFASKSISERALVLVAGAIMNLIFGFIFFVVAFAFGVRFEAPVVGTVSPGGPAWNAGILPGDRILEVNGEPKEDWEDLMTTIILAGLDPVQLRIQRGEGEHEQLLDLTVKPTKDARLGMPTIGVGASYAPKIAKVSGSAEASGLQVGDRLLSAQLVPAQGNPVTIPTELPPSHPVDHSDQLDRRTSGRPSKSEGRPSRNHPQHRHSDSQGRRTGHGWSR